MLWSDIPRRLATICMGVPILWKVLQLPLLAHVFFGGAHALSAWEFSLLQPNSGNSGVSDKWQHRILFCVASVALASICLVFPIDNDSSAVSTSLFQLLLPLVAGIFVMMQQLHFVTGLVLFTIPFYCWTLIQLRPDAFASTVAILLVVWNADTGALLLGRIMIVVRSKQQVLLPPIPVPRWIHVISPKKTMEGFLGGILGGTWTAVQWVPALVRWSSSSMEISPAFDTIWMSSTWQQRVGLGLILSLLAIVGDLVESSIKRQSQAKDSGNVLPGHGGILDRFDSSLLAVCFYVALLNWVATT